MYLLLDPLKPKPLLKTLFVTSFKLLSRQLIPSPSLSSSSLYVVRNDSSRIRLNVPSSSRRVVLWRVSSVCDNFSRGRSFPYPVPWVTFFFPYKFSPYTKIRYRTSLFHPSKLILSRFFVVTKYHKIWMFHPELMPIVYNLRQNAPYVSSVWKTFIQIKLI